MTHQVIKERNAYNMTTPYRVLVLGGYGNFGLLIVTKLSQIPSVEVIVGGHNLKKAEAAAKKHGSHAAHVDSTAENLADRFRELQIKVVINTVGPFQGQNYHVAQAAINAGIHYIDIADAREFVMGISALDAAAMEKEVMVVSGASSIPTLAAAVIDMHLPEFEQLQIIDYGITSSEKIPGAATVQAVMGYVGKPFRQWRDGAWKWVYGWQSTTRHRFASALGTRWFGNCDVPDLEIFPQRYSGVRTVRFRAGLGLRTTHCGLWWLSWLVRFKLFRSAKLLAPFLTKIATILQPLGNGRSGMFVKLTGTGKSGHSITRVWELNATKNDGANIPGMAAVALVRKLAEGKFWGKGATPCVDIVTLDEYLYELRDFAVKITRY
jgi:saccharopine dehydrogenase-like NADP-dependent oxidoreductase